MFQKKKDYITYKDIEYKIDDSFNNVLQILKMIEDKELEEHERLALFVEMATGIECINEKGLTQEIVWLDEMKDLIADFLFKNKEEKDEEQKNKKLYDFDKDAEMIFASFLQDYNVDLTEQLDKMSFEKFLALLKNLNSKTPFKKALYYRSCKIPAQTKYNKNEIEHIKKMKDFYKLEDTTLTKEEKEKERRFAEDAKFQALKKLAKKKVD